MRLFVIEKLKFKNNNNYSCHCQVLKIKHNYSVYTQVKQIEEEEEVTFQRCILKMIGEKILQKRLIIQSAMGRLVRVLFF